MSNASIWVAEGTMITFKNHPLNFECKYHTQVWLYDATTQPTKAIYLSLINARCRRFYDLWTINSVPGEVRPLFRKSLPSQVSELSFSRYAALRAGNMINDSLGFQTARSGSLRGWLLINCSNMWIFLLFEKEDFPKMVLLIAGRLPSKVLFREAPRALIDLLLISLLGQVARSSNSSGSVPLRFPE